MRTGLRVFQCKGKRPAVRSWPTDNVDSSEFVLRQGESYGIVCDNFAVIDFDDRASLETYPQGVFGYFCEKDGVSLARLISQACIVKTPHGYHLYVAADDALKQGQGFKDSEGRDMHVDIRSQGRGYVIGPGSVVEADGRYPGENKGDHLQYMALSDFDHAPLVPLDRIFPSLYKLLTTQGSASRVIKLKKTPGDRADKGSVPFDGTTTWRPASLYDGLCQLAGANEGERNQILFGLARYVKSFRNVSRDVKEVRLNKIREIALDIGLPASEIDATIESAGNIKSVQAAMEAMDEIESEDYIRNRVGDILPNEYNLCRGFETGDLDVSDFCIDCQDYLIYKPLRGVVAETSDLHDQSESELVRRIDWFFKCATKSRANFLKPAVAWIRHNARELPAQEFLAEVQQDGPIVSVEELWEHMGIEAADRAQSIRWLEACMLQTIRRIFQKGAPLENIAILWGPQRTHKSSVVKALFDPYWVDPILNKYSSDIRLTTELSNDLRDEQLVGLKIRSMFCVELSELAALKRTSEIASIRDFITKNADHYRAPYAPKAEMQPRTCSFIGTSNEEPELADQTGNRRYCLFNVMRPIDTVWIVENRVAIWRNLYQICQREPYRVVLTSEENACKEQVLSMNAFATLDYADHILEYLARAPTGRLSRTDIENYLCNDDAGPRLRQSRVLKSNIDSVMAAIGNKRRRGRYSSYIYTPEAKETVRKWVESGDDVAGDNEPTMVERLRALEEENLALKEQASSPKIPAEMVSREEYEALKKKFMELAAAMEKFI